MDRRVGRDWEGPITRNRRSIGAYRVIVPHLIDNSEDMDSMDGFPSNRVGTF